MGKNFCKIYAYNSKKKYESLKSMTIEERIEHRRSQHRKNTLKYRTQKKEMIAAQEMFIEIDDKINNTDNTNNTNNTNNTIQFTKKNVKTLKGITKYELIMAEKMFRELNKEPNKDNKIKKIRFKNDTKQKIFNKST